MTASESQICVIGNGIYDSIGILPEKPTLIAIHSETEQGFRCAIYSLAYRSWTGLQEYHCETETWHCRPMPANGNEIFRSAVIRRGFSTPNAIWPNQTGTVAILPAIVSVKRNEIYRTAGIPNGTDLSRPSWIDCDSVAFRTGNDWLAASWIWNRGGPGSSPE